jgi:hypothetical protein
MRLLIAVAACAILFAGALWGSAKIFPTGEPVARAAEANPLSTTAESAETEKAPKDVESKSGSGSHEPRKRLVPTDMAIAHAAVLQPNDVNSIWRPLPAPLSGGHACPENNPDRSRFTITGQGRSIFKSGVGALTESRVTLYKNAGQAALSFEATNNRANLRCIREGIKSWLQGRGLKPRVRYAKLQREPAIGSQTAIYLVGYVITVSDGTRYVYPVELLNFQTGRAIGSLQYTLVFSPDGSRPCKCELDEARLVSSRLSRT